MSEFESQSQFFILCAQLNITQDLSLLLSLLNSNNHCVGHEKNDSNI